MNTAYLTKEHIIAIHHELIEQFGGIHGIRDEALLESAIGRYQSGYYADHVEEAAALMESLGGNHPFIDGNKRIAVAATFTFLTINGYEVTAEEEAAFEFISGLFESHEFSFGRLEAWIRVNVRNLGGPTYESEREAHAVQAMNNCLSALQNILSAKKEIDDSIDKRNEELNRIKNKFSTAKGTNATVLAKGLRACIGQISTITLDLLTYSERMDAEGRKFLEGWVTSAQWLEEEIPVITDTDKDELLDLLHTLKTMVLTVRTNMHLLPNSFNSLLSLGDAMPQTLNTRKTQINKIHKQFIRKIVQLKESLNRCLEVHKEFDGQLEITNHSLDRLLKLSGAE